MRNLVYGAAVVESILSPSSNGSNAWNREFDISKKTKEKSSCVPVRSERSEMQLPKSATWNVRYLMLFHRTPPWKEFTAAIQRNNLFES